MENSKSNWIKTYIVDVLPCLSIALYLLAYTYNISFYQVFNIDIIPYLSFNDTLQSIIKPLIMILLASTGIMAFFTQSIPLLIGEKKHAKNANKRTVHYFTMDFTIISVVSLALFFILVFCFDIPNGNLYAPTICVLIPFFLVILYFLIATSNKKIADRLLTINNCSRIDMFIMVLSYYIFAFLVFNVSGSKKGKYIMNHNQIAFEIKLSDGTLYNDSEYTYISYLNCNYFLYERKTKDVIIIPNDKLNYVKINNQKKND